MDNSSQHPCKIPPSHRPDFRHFDAVKNISACIGHSEPNGARYIKEVVTKICTPELAAPISKLFPYQYGCLLPNNVEKCLSMFFSQRVGKSILANYVQTVHTQLS